MGGIEETVACVRPPGNFLKKVRFELEISRFAALIPKLLGCDPPVWEALSLPP